MPPKKTAKPLSAYLDLFSVQRHTDFFLQRTLENPQNLSEHIRDLRNTMNRYGITKAAEAYSRTILNFCRQYDIMQYRIQAEFDERTTDGCRDLHNHTFMVDDAQLESNLPPFHFRCRCRIVPHFEEGAQHDFVALSLAARAQGMADFNALTPQQGQLEEMFLQQQHRYLPFLDPSQILGLGHGPLRLQTAQAYVLRRNMRVRGWNLFYPHNNGRAIFEAVADAVQEFEDDEHYWKWLGWRLEQMCDLDQMRWLLERMQGDFPEREIPLESFHPDIREELVLAQWFALQAMQVNIVHPPTGMDFEQARTFSAQIEQAMADLRHANPSIPFPGWSGMSDEQRAQIQREAEIMGPILLTLLGAPGWVSLGMVAAAAIAREGEVNASVVRDVAISAGASTAGRVVADNPIVQEGVAWATGEIWHWLYYLLWEFEPEHRDREPWPDVWR